MSREAGPGRGGTVTPEVVGDLTDAVDAAALTAQPTLSDRLGRRGLTVAVTAATLAAGALGWFGPELARALPDQGEPMVSVTLVGRAFESETGGIRHLTMTAEVVNLGSSPVQVLGLASTASALSVAAGFSTGLIVPSRSDRRITLTVQLECSSPSPLRLPQLQLRDDAGTTFRRTVTGSSQRLVTECQSENLVTEPTGVQASDVRVSGDQLVMSLTTVGRRSLRLLTASAGGLPLAVTPTPLTLSPGIGQRVRLDPPHTCPPDWAVSGPKGQLDLEVDWGTDLPLSADGGSDPFRPQVETAWDVRAFGCSCLCLARAVGRRMRACPG